MFNGVVRLILTQMLALQCKKKLAHKFRVKKIFTAVCTRLTFPSWRLMWLVGRQVSKLLSVIHQPPLVAQALSVDHEPASVTCQPLSVKCLPRPSPGAFADWWVYRGMGSGKGVVHDLLVYYQSKLAERVRAFVKARVCCSRGKSMPPVHTSRWRMSLYNAGAFRGACTRGNTCGKVTDWTVADERNRFGGAGGWDCVDGRVACRTIPRQQRSCGCVSGRGSGACVCRGAGAVVERGVCGRPGPPALVPLDQCTTSTSVSRGCEGGDGTVPQGRAVTWQTSRGERGQHPMHPSSLIPSCRARRNPHFLGACGGEQQGGGGGGLGGITCRGGQRGPGGHHARRGTKGGRGVSRAEEDKVGVEGHHVRRGTRGEG